ncbi:MAG: hypothetical protein K2J38_03335 [Muribaculaceae bacterium]|nr:hypothetical protein [Muribaculaceae bacterium]
MKKLIVALVAVLPMLCQAQRAEVTDFFSEGDNVVVKYRLTEKAATISLFISENGGEWQLLEQVSGDVGSNVTEGNNSIVWDVYKEKPKGVSGKVRFVVVPDYVRPSTDNLPSGLPSYNIVLRGNKAYYTRKTNYSSTYAGDIRKGTYASATDKISYNIEVYEYDFVTGEETMLESFGWSGRVARKQPSGDAARVSFPVVTPPNHRINIDKEGRVCLDKRIIVN